MKRYILFLCLLIPLINFAQSNFKVDRTTSPVTLTTASQVSNGNSFGELSDPSTVILM